MFVIDERDAASRSSINQKGHYQTDLMGLAVEVKDSAQNPDKWAYYGFDADGKTAGAMPQGQRMLGLPRCPRRGRTHIRAVLSHAEAGGEEVWRVQRIARAGDKIVKWGGSTVVTQTG